MLLCRDAQAKAREETGSMLRVTPLSGTIPPLSSTPLHVTFAPVAPPQPKGFAAQPLSATQAQAQPFDGLLQVCEGACILHAVLHGKR